jgi:hypothetical protein
MAVGNGPLAVDNPRQYQPQESPANRHINGGAVDAGGILLGLLTRTTSPLLPQSLTANQCSFKAALNVVEAEERLMDDPEDLPGEATAQIGLYTHRRQDS